MKGAFVEGWAKVQNSADYWVQTITSFCGCSYILLYFRYSNSFILYSIVDIETTGGVAAHCGITEIAIYQHNGERVVETFHSLINPQQPIPYHITNLTGISNAMVAVAPTFNELAPAIYELLKDTTFVAHNVHFDFSFIKHGLHRSGYELAVSKLCTVRLSRKIFPGFDSYSLGKLCHQLGIDIADRHRARGDAEATVLLFEKLLEKDSDTVLKMKR